MADEKDTLKPHTSLPDKSIPRRFWDYQQDNGTWKSILWLHKEFDGDLIRVRAQIPSIVEEGNSRGVDMVEFLKEFTDALGANYDAGQLSADGSDQDNQPEDEDESGETRTTSGSSDSCETEQEGS